MLLGVTTVLTTASALATGHRDMESVDAAAELELMKLFNRSDVKAMDSKALKYFYVFMYASNVLWSTLKAYI